MDEFLTNHRFHTCLKTGNRFTVASFLYENGIRFKYDEFVGTDKHDILIKTEMGYVVIDIDECDYIFFNPHFELTRMIDFQIILDKPVIYIRFNIDSDNLTYLLSVVKWAMNEKQLINQDHELCRIAFFYTYTDIFNIKGSMLRFIK